MKSSEHVDTIVELKVFIVVDMFLLKVLTEPHFSILGVTAVYHRKLGVVFYCMPCNLSL